MEPLLSKATILLLTLILLLIFLLSTLIYFLLKYLLSTSTSPDYDDEDDASVTAAQGRLHQLFLLHDCGVDQRFIDALPRFRYAAIAARGDDAFDCAVCLCEFESEDALRLLPECGHAFHVGCIDTWLLAHSTCPLCRSNILAECAVTDPSLSYDGSVDEGVAEERVVTVKLGSFRKVGGSEEEEGPDKRRCFSMGSYEYVMDESSSLRVAVRAVSFRLPIRREPEQHEADVEAARIGATPSFARRTMMWIVNR